MTTTSSSSNPFAAPHGHGQDGSHLPSISLPSALKPARVSISSSSSSSPSASPAAASPARAGQAPHVLLSATQSFYGSPSRRPGQAGALGGGGGGPGTTTSAGTGTGILPSAAFLSPRKPSAVLARQQQRQQQQSQQDAHDRTPRPARAAVPAGSAIASAVPGVALTTSSVAMYPVRSSYSDDARRESSSGTVTGEESDLAPTPLSKSPRESSEHDGHAATSSSGSGSNLASGLGPHAQRHSHGPYGHAQSQSGYGPAASGSLGRNGSLDQHTRAASRQDTLASKASREPLIWYPSGVSEQVAEEWASGGPERERAEADAAGRQITRGSRNSTHGLPAPDSRRRSDHGERRKSSKTGSIGSLLGFGRGISSDNTPNVALPASEKRKSSLYASTIRPRTATNGRDGQLPSLREKGDEGMGEKGTSPRKQAQDTHPQERTFRPYSVAHTTVPILSEATQKPLRNYQVYKQQQRASRTGLSQSKSSSAGASPSFFAKLLGKVPYPPASEKREQDIAPFGYGTDNLGGNTRFLLSGRLLTSGDSPFPFLASLLFAVLMPVGFLAFEVEWLWRNTPAGGLDGQGSSAGSIHSAAGKALVVLFAYSTLIMWSSMLRTSLRDPGIIPKGLDRQPDFESFAVPVGGEDDLTGNGMGQRPKMRYVRVREELVGSKWCETCQTYRPPRTSHCRLCDVCTEQTDHHCSFLNNCIGRRNYNSFIAFLLSGIACGLFVIGISVAHLVVQSRDVGTAAFLSGWRTIGTLVVLIVTTAAIMPLIGLTGYHCRLIWLGRTTIEMIRPKYPTDPDGPNKGRPSNPYSYASRWNNVLGTLCRPMDLHSGIQPHDYARKDAREENPAFA